jgi:hypothetical protein
VPKAIAATQPAANAKVSLFIAILPKNVFAILFVV